MMNKRTVTLLSVLGVLGLAYVWFVLWPGGGDLQVKVVQRPQRPVSFVFNRDLRFEEVKVWTFEPGPADDPEAGFERVIWHMVAEEDEEPEARNTVVYGRRMRGMEPAEGMPRRGEDLKPGGKYRFEGRTAAGELIEAEFRRG